MMLCVPVVAGMIGYGLAKAAVHQLVQSLGAENSGMPTDSLAVAILPWVLLSSFTSALLHQGKDSGICWLYTVLAVILLHKSYL